MSNALHDALAAAVWLAVNALLVRAACVLAARAFPRDTLFQRLLHVGLLCWACVVAAALVLGAIGALLPGLLLGAVAAAAMGGLVAKTRIARAASPHGTPQRAFPTEGDGVWLWLWGAMLAYWLGNVVVGALLEFPDDWDSLMYHIPLVDQWLHAKGLHAPDDAVWYNPGNNELVGLWMVAPFSGDFLIGLGNLPAAILLGLGALELALQCGVRAVSAHLAAFVAVANYVVLRQLLDSENDVAVAGLFVTCLAYAVRHAREGGRASLLLSSAACGLLAGVKYYALGYAGLAAVMMVVMAGLARGFEGRKRDAYATGHGFRAAGRAALASTGGMLLWGGYWYLRNAYFTGAPLYPRGLSPSNDLLSEMRPDAWSSTLLGNKSPEVPALFIDCLWQSVGMAHLIACAFAPTAAIWLLVSLVLRKRRQGRGLDWLIRPCLVLLLLGSALLLGITPFAVETTPGTLNMLRMGYLPARFGACFLTLAVVAFVLVLDDLQPVLERWGLALAGRWLDVAKASAVRKVANGLSYAPHAAYAIAGLAQLYPTAFRKLPGSRIDGVLVAVNIALACLCAAWLTQLRRRIWLLPPLVALAIVAVVALGQHWHEGFAGHYDHRFRTKVFSHRDTWNGESAKTCVLDYRYYPFFGSRRQFRLCRPMWVPTYPALLDYLRERGSEVVVSINHDYILNGRYLETKAWLDADARRFAPLETDNRFSVYRRRPGTGTQVARSEAQRGE